MTKQNLKIHVKSEEESRQAQECLFKMGYKWGGRNTKVQYLDAQYLYIGDPFGIQFDCDDDLYFAKYDAKQVTLQELKEMAVLQRNDKGDATHKALNGWLYYLGKEEAYCWNEDDKSWFKAANSSEDLKDILTQLNEEKKGVCVISGANAKKAWANGEAVEVKYRLDGDWEILDDDYFLGVFSDNDYSFKLKPQTIKIGDVEVPKPESEPLKDGDIYYVPLIHSNGFVSKCIWVSSVFDKAVVKRGLVHRTKAAATEHAFALIKISGGSVNEL